MLRKALGLLATAAFGFGVAQSASAADMPIKAPPAAVVVSTWTGFYIGANGGYAWAKKDWFDISDAASLGSHTAVGGVVGGQVGYDFQTGPWVFGIRGMYDWADLNGSNIVPTGTNIVSTNVRSFATAVGRIGYLFAPNTLAYGLGGAAWAWDRYRISTGAGVEFANASETKTGYVVGMGLEHKFAANWSVFVEYDYLHCGCVVPINENPAAPPLVPGGTTGTPQVDITQQVSTVLLGINYRFGGL
jgi:outer membrane immunogenic protein